MLSLHPIFFIFGEQIVDEYHCEPENDDEESGPEDGEKNPPT
jgi:hypothetical protein